MATIERVLVTGCLGFIGSHFVKYLLKADPDLKVVGLSRNTDQKNQARIEDVLNDPNFQLIYRDLNDANLTEDLEGIDIVFNFGAKTFVDYSIRDPKPFMESNLMGTFNLLEASRKNQCGLYVQISTDEVYGTISEGKHTEKSPLNPTNPYASTKAGGDMLCLSYAETYCMPVLITRTENNYGYYQHQQKVMPTFVRKALSNQKLPLYGDGKHKRMWLRVEDHCSAIWHLIQHGYRGIVNIAGNEELENIELAKLILQTLDREEDQIQFIDDRKIRPSHDRRYAIDASLLLSTGWKPKYKLKEGIIDAVKWYEENEWWFS